MKKIQEYLRNVKENFAIIRDTFDWEDEANQETVFTLSNGYMGIRGALEVAGLKKQAGTYIAGLFDKREDGESNEVCGLTLKNKAVTPAYAIVPDTNLIKIESDGFSFDFINSEVVSFKRILDMYRGIVLNEYALRNRQGKTVCVKTMTIVSKTQLHNVLYKVEIIPVDFCGKLSVTFQNSLCQNPQFIPRLKDYISKTDLISVQEVDGACLLNAKVAETGAEIAVKTKTNGAGERYVFKTQNGIDEMFSLDVVSGETYEFEKQAVYYTSQDKTTDSTAFFNAEELIEGHFAYWEKAWEKADVCIEGDDEVQKGVRWNIYNLTQLGNPYDSDISIAATGLHGQGYFGHAFWDTEIFMLPFYLATNPEVAKALLLYRYNRLDEARALAKANGYLGAKYPWTSAYTGKDVTPPDWERCAKRQIHISGDVAYAFYNYYEQTGDEAFYKEKALEVIVETAKFYASRATKEADGKYHILDVIGPDEYNIHADDNYYTNHLVAWNLRAALNGMEKLEKEDPVSYQKIERATDYRKNQELLKSVAENLSFPKIQNNVCEQYNGFFDLKDNGEIERDEFGMPKNKNYVYASGAQVLKQADVVMMHYLFPDDFSEEVKKESFSYYEKRCNHGSSLSPSIHCIVGLRNGFSKHAYGYLYLTALLDLKNLHLDKNLHEGLHTACAGGTWAAAVYGFGGVQIKRGELHINPYLPEKWNGLTYSFINKGVTYKVAVNKKGFTVVADKDSKIFVQGKMQVLKQQEEKNFSAGF